MAYDKKGKTSATSNGFDKRRDDAKAAGKASKRGKSPKTVIRETLKKEKNQDKINDIIESYLDRAHKGDLEAQEFLIKNGLWLKEVEDVESSIVMPTFVVNAPIEPSDEDPSPTINDD